MQNGASGQDEGATSPITPIVQAAATPPVRSATVHGVTDVAPSGIMFADHASWRRRWCDRTSV
eukprot:CAMPEP_0113530320 /NCGR_PEP_ID=MMETSP0015_2-20120614/2872_1 /TAXON_ID=2838 /ORGANISM="Odontella" /LENGTH=62 /DNA_ID=CAMNT_0000429025 /DNA_START=350 /DNA_END=539 /DNA_ORIENTATION=+ /assembly_acc=CAM_ASM_000160